MALYPIVDPHGLVTPLHDGWSIDFWFFGRNGETLFPSREDHVVQKLMDGDDRVVRKGQLTKATSRGKSKAID